MEYIGIDGCRSGWFCIGLGQDGDYQFEVVSCTDKLAELASGAKLVLIDVPIGLIDSGAEERICDKEARRVLGAPRASSVFPAPARASLDVMSYEEASALNRELTGRGLSRQSWAIAPKIKEIDQLIRSRSDLKCKVRECHPEVCFWALNKRNPMANNKKKIVGREERLAVLSRYLPQANTIISAAATAFPRKEVAWDDIVDALVAVVTAKYGCDQLATLPESPQIDDCGLSMEMVYADL